MCFLDVVKEFDTKAYKAFAAQRNSLLSETSQISDYKNSTTHTSVLRVIWDNKLKKRAFS